MTVISADGAGSLGRSVAANVAQGLQLSGDLTGVDVAALLRRLVVRHRWPTASPASRSPPTGTASTRGRDHRRLAGRHAGGGNQMPMIKAEATAGSR
jgi:hypothetical protein